MRVKTFGLCGRGRQRSERRAPVARPLPRTRAFTLIELLVVMAIIALLATAAMVLMHGKTDDIRATVYNANRRVLQDQVLRYQFEHGELPSPDRFEEQMTMATNKVGQVAPPGTPGYRFGPYLERIPVNPYTGGSSVGIADGADWNVGVLTGDPAELAARARRQISLLYDAAASYSSDHGAFPPSLGALRGAYINEDDFMAIMVSPRTGRVFGYTPAPPGQRDVELIQETGDSGGLLVCYADGRIEEAS